jgi:hypothetical protein
MSVQVEQNKQISAPCMNQSGKGLLTLPPEVRNMIWELLVIKESDVVLDGLIPYPRLPYSRPPILKVCHQIEKEASPIFWGRSVIVLKDYHLYDFAEDMGEGVVRMIRRLKMVWSADSEARVDWLDVDYTRDFCGLKSLELCLSRDAGRYDGGEGSTGLCKMPCL